MTIIVLLILAGVSLSIVMQGGILDKSQLAVNEYKNSANDEDNTIKDMDKYLDKQLNIYKNDGVDMDKAKEDLEKNPENYIHPDQSSTNGDRAVGTDGKAVNMDLWDGWQKEDDGAHLDWFQIGSSNFDDPFYLNSNLEGGKIKGTVPQYIYSEEDGKVYPVVSMEKTFRYSDIVIPPKITSTVTNMNETFNECHALKEAPKLPDGVINMWSTFNGCVLLETAPELPSKVEDIGYTFARCSGLKTAPSKIPDSVINMSGTFAGCGLLERIPEIPSKVKDISGAFYECSSLTGDLIINAENVEVYEECLAEAATNPGCDLKLTGSCPQLNEILGTATSGNVSLKE